MVAVTGLAAAASYAAVKSFWACSAAALAALMVPLTCPGGNPVTDVPGLSPRSPLIVVGPVFVTVDAASTAKGPALPSETGAVAGAAAAAPAPPAPPIRTVMAAARAATAASRNGEGILRIMRVMVVLTMGFSSRTLYSADVFGLLIA